MDAPLHIEIRQARSGFEGFFGSWVVLGPNNVVVDTGPASSAGNLVAGLEALGLKRVDWVLLTHIHIDHAGGLAAVLARYPEAKAVCHAAGLRFLADPTRLWAGSQKVLGELAEFYGRPDSVPAERLVPHDSMAFNGLQIVETPGHAPHHLSYRLRGRIYAGEAGGNLLKVQGHPYLRPATPPRFFLPEALASVDRLLDLDDQPIHYAHFDQAESSKEMLGRFRRQLLRWCDIVSGVLIEGEDEVEARCIAALLQGDPELAAFHYMDQTVRTRERSFMANSVRGYLGYLKEQAQAPE
ncbi:MAG: MBL fold metallo-hydrolase [Thermodesulfobacteriota bacterium]